MIEVYSSEAKKHKSSKLLTLLTTAIIGITVSWLYYAEDQHSISYGVGTLTTSIYIAFQNKLPFWKIFYALGLGLISFMLIEGLFGISEFLSEHQLPKFLLHEYLIGSVLITSLGLIYGSLKRLLG